MQKSKFNFQNKILIKTIELYEGWLYIDIFMLKFAELIFMQKVLALKKKGKICTPQQLLSIRYFLLIYPCLGQFVY